MEADQAVMNATAAIAHRPLATLDLAIIGVYFLIVFCIGLYFARKERTSTDYFLAGRDVGWFFIGASLFVSNISTEHFIGLSGTGASSGLAVGHFEWLACIMLLILGWVFVPFYLRTIVFTMPEFLERRFNRQCAVYLAAISIIAYIFTKISVQRYAASVVLERIGGWSLVKTAIILVIATGIYTIAGSHAGAARHHGVCLVSRSAGRQARLRLSHAGSEPASYWTGRSCNGGSAGGRDGRNEFGIQLRVHPGHIGFL